MRSRITRTIRRGMSAVEIGVVLALVTLGAATAGGYLSQGASTKLQTTANGVADPAQLVNQFAP